MRKTKIICTLGPSTDKEGVMRELILAGMNIARFNFSHGDYEEHKGRLDKLKEVEAECAAKGVKVISVSADVSIYEDCQKVVKEAIDACNDLNDAIEVARQALIND